MSVTVGLYRVKVDGQGREYITPHPARVEIMTGGQGQKVHGSAVWVRGKKYEKRMLPQNTRPMT